MLDIIKSEIFKVRKSKNTFVITIILLAIALLNCAVYGYMKILGGEYEKMFSSTNAAEIYVGMTVGSFFLIFVALFVGGVISNEFTFGTVRQVVSRGTRREKIAIGQYVSLSLAIHIVSIICSVVITAVYVMLYGMNGAEWKDFALVFIGQTIIIWSYSAFSMLIAHITRSGSLAIGVNILILLGGEVGVMLLSFITKKDIFQELWLTSLQADSISLTATTTERMRGWGLLALFGVVCVVVATVLFRKRDVN